MDLERLLFTRANIENVGELLVIIHRCMNEVNYKDYASHEFKKYLANFIYLVSKKFALLKKPVNPSRFRTHPAVPELSALCIILAVFLKGGKNVSADSA
ncbi:hypothetical protein C804_01990 [Lachnospiraceae bacterium A4]|nr:hypothetical protein C804_01990 [Lachnospiraceae bacterium A4]